MMTVWTSVHDVLEVSFDKPERLDESSSRTWTRTLKVQTREGEFVLNLFSDSSDKLSEKH